MAVSRDHLSSKHFVWGSLSLGGNEGSCTGVSRSVEYPAVSEILQLWSTIGLTVMLSAVLATSVHAGFYVHTEDKHSSLTQKGTALFMSGPLPFFSPKLF